METHQTQSPMTTEQISPPSARSRLVMESATLVGRFPEHSVVWQRAPPSSHSKSSRSSLSSISEDDVNELASSTCNSGNIVEELSGLSDGCRIEHDVPQPFTSTMPESPKLRAASQPTISATVGEYMLIPRSRSYSAAEARPAPMRPAGSPLRSHMVTLALGEVDEQPVALELNKETLACSAGDSLSTYTPAIFVSEPGSEDGIVAPKTVLLVAPSPPASSRSSESSEASMSSASSTSSRVSTTDSRSTVTAPSPSVPTNARGSSWSSWSSPEAFARRAEARRLALLASLGTPQ